MPLNYVLRDLLGYAKTAREVRKILNDGNVLVDKKVRKNPSFGVGVMDIIEIPKDKKQFIVLPVKGKTVLKEIDGKHSNVKFCHAEEFFRMKLSWCQCMHSIIKCIISGYNIILDIIEQLSAREWG